MLLKLMETNFQLFYLAPSVLAPCASYPTTPQGFSPPLVRSPSLLREASLLCEAASYTHVLSLPYPLPPTQVLSSPNPPLSLDLQAIEPIMLPQASPTRARSPDVISSASTAMSQDIPEIASETLQRGLGGAAAEARDPLQSLHTDSMASAASALHLLSPRNRNAVEHSLMPLELGGDSEQRLSNTPSLLETALSQENAAAAAAAAVSCSDSGAKHSWPAAPDITRETRISLRDNGLGDW